MPGLNLTAEDQQNHNDGILFSNTAYDLNNAVTQNRTSIIQVGQVLVPITDMAGQPGYTALPIDGLSSQYVTEQVLTDLTGGGDSGLNAFIAYDAANHKAGIGIAGTNGVLGLEPGAAADNAQLTQSMSGQYEDFIRGGGLQSLRELAGDDPAGFSIVGGAQSSGATLLDAVIMTAQEKTGVSVRL